MKIENLREEIEAELEQIHLTCAEVQSLIRDTAGREATVRERTAGEGFLAQFYNGVENILKRFAQHLDTPMPSGDTWHLELALMFLPGNSFGMPPLFTFELHETMSLFRRYRHSIRHSYGHELVWARLLPGLQALPEAAKQFEKAVISGLENLQKIN